MPKSYPITHPTSGASSRAPAAHWRFSLQELRNRIAHGQVWGLAQSLGDIMDVLAFLCILRVEEQEEAERRAVADFNGTESEPEFPDAARWDVLKAVPADQFAAHIQEQLFSFFRDAPASSPLRLLPRLFQPSRFPAEAYQAAMAMLSSPMLPFEQYLELERSEKSMGLEDKAAELFNGWKGVGEFITPSRVADLMIDLAAPQPGERIYNPCTGFGTLLVRAAKRVILPGLREFSPAEARRVMASSFYGMELNPSICLVALARLMLAGVTRPRLELGDVLERPAPDARDNGGFDVILCNPPFGSSAAPEQMSRFPIQSRSTETLILQHILSHLRPGGRAVVLMPEAFLYRQGPEEVLRKRLLKEFRLESVVALPEGTIHGLGELRTSLLVVHRQESVENVVFIPAKTTQEVLYGYREGHGKNAVLPRVLAALGRAESEEESTEEMSTGSRAARLVINRENVEALAGRRWELVSKSRGVDKLQVLLDTLQRTEARAEILQLSSAGSVSSGMSYNRSDMAEGFYADRPAEEDVRLVRVRDLSSLRGPDSLKLVATPTMARMTAEGARRAADHTRLRSGDILLTVTGTVGKVAVVGEGGPKLIAASGVDIIRVRDAALASYLPRLLTTEPYQDWLWRRSIGTALSRLRVDDVKHIPVPLFTGGVPPEAIRHVSVGQSLEGLIRLLESKPRFSASVRFLLEDSLVRNLGDEPIEGQKFTLTAKGLRSLLPRIGEVLRDGTIDEGIEPLHDWLRTFHDFTARLVDVLDLPVGPERFSSLQAWKLALDSQAGDFQKAREELRSRAQRSRRGDSQREIVTVQERSEALLEALIDVWQSDCDEHLNSARLTATLSPAIVTIGLATEISVSVVNEGVLPLRKLSFETRPHESQSQCNLLRAGATYQWPLKVVGRESGKQTLAVRWTGRRMDESEASGDIELAFEVVSLRAAARVTRLEKSPYVVGSPLDPKSKVFFGRDDLIAQINRTLRTEGPSTVILLEGNRRVGKSSLLKRLANGAMPAGWIPVYVNFQSFDGTAGKPGMATQEIFYGIAKELIVAAARAVPTYRVPDVEDAVPAQEGMQQTAFFIKRVRPLFKTESSFEVFRLIVESVLAAVEPRRLLLMLDEFDKIQEGIDAGITSPQLPENLRNLFHSYERVSGILTGSRTIRRLREEYWSVLFGLGIPIPIKGLDDAASRKLVTDPVKGQLVYAPSAIDFVVERCARQPFLIQGLCHSIFELCAASDERTVTVEVAVKAADRYAKDNEHFRSIWNHIGNHRRQYLVCVVDELASQDAPVTLEFLRLTLEQRGIAYRAIKVLREDLDELVAFEILGVDGGQRQQRYRIEIPIFSEWLRRNVDSAAHRLEAINATR